MSDSHLEYLPSNNLTLRSTQVTCQTLPNTCPKQVLANSFSSLKNSDLLNSNNNIYQLSQQIQQRNLDISSEQSHPYLNNTAIIESFQKFDQLHNQSLQQIASNRGSMEQQKNSYQPSSATHLTQQKAPYSQKELMMEKQRLVNQFYNNLSSKQQSAQINQRSMQELYSPENNKNQKTNQLDITTQLSEQLQRSNETNQELLQKLKSVLQENEKLKLQLISYEQKQQKSQIMEGPLLRQTQLRDDVRKEVEDKLISKHQQEMNAVVTKYSREKAMMIKTIEMQRLRILDNERIMLQMEGDLERVQENNSTINKSQNSSHKLEKNSFEIPEEQTQSQVEQTEISSLDKIPQFGQQQNHQTPQIKINPSQIQTNNTQRKSIQKNQPTANKGKNNGGNESNSYTNLPSSQTNIGHNSNHKRFNSSTSTPQQIPGFDLFCVQYEQNSPEKNAYAGSKSQKSLSSASKQLTQSQSTNMTNRSSSKYLTTSSANNLTYQKRNSFNNGSQLNNSKNFSNIQSSRSSYLSPYQQQFNQIMNSQNPNSSYLSTSIAPMSEQVGIRSSLHSQIRISEQSQPDLELNEALNIPMKKLSITSKQQNSNSMTPSSINQSQRTSTLSQLNPTHYQGDMQSKTMPLIYNSDESVHIFNRFKNNIESLTQL